MSRVSAERIEREIAGLAGRGLPAEAYRRAVLERIAAAVPVTAACLAAADPGTLALVGHTSAGFVREGTNRLYEAEYGVADVASHRSLAAGAPARVLSEVTRGELERSHRYRTLMRPMGWEHELRAAATDRGGTWGFVHLYRSSALPDFTADDLALLERLGPVIAAGLRTALLPGVVAPVPAAMAPAVWVLDEACRLVQATPGSETLLAALRDDQAPADEPPEVLVGLAVLARTAAARAQPGTLPEVPRLQVPTTDGDWVTLQASVLRAVGGGPEQVVLTSTPAAAGDLLELSLLAYRLTPAERAAVALVLAGRSTKQIAEELVLSPHTVQDRMQDVFAKVGVRSRRELVAVLG